MTSRKALLVLSALTAIIISSIAAASASANTAYECASATAGAKFSDEHCKFFGAGLGFRHVEIAPNSSTPITLTNRTTGAEWSTLKLKSVQAGVTLEIQALTASGSGFINNKEEFGTMYAEAFGTLGLYNVSVTAPAGKGCKVSGGTIVTKVLRMTTKGLSNQLKLSPESGSIAKFSVEGCSVAALNHAYELTGSVTGATTGTTTNFTHAATTEQGTLQLFGQKAGLEGSITITTGVTGIAFT
jgi:hypothetical protein